MQQDEWLTKAEVATELGKSRPAIDRWLAKGKLPAPIKKGRIYLFRKKDIQRIKEGLQ